MLLFYKLMQLKGTQNAFVFQYSKSPNALGHCLAAVVQSWKVKHDSLAAPGVTSSNFGAGYN